VILLRRAIAFFVPAAIVAVLCAGLAYAETQQSLRSGANDPQVAMAEDAATRLDTGAPPASVIGAEPVAIASGLAPFTVVLDAAGHVLAADGTLDGAEPAIPAGVLRSATDTGRDVVTWQPRPRVRVALVVEPWSGGTVAVGRSLRLVEEREDATLLLAVAGVLVLLVALAIGSLLAAAIWPSGSVPS